VEKLQEGRIAIKFIVTIDLMCRKALDHKLLKFTVPSFDGERAKPIYPTKAAELGFNEGENFSKILLNDIPKRSCESLQALQPSLV